MILKDPQKELVTLREDVDLLQTRRPFQEDFFPTVIQKRSLGNVITPWEGGVTVTLPAGSAVTLEGTISNANGAEVTSSADWTLYIDTANEAGHYPYGSGIARTSWFVDAWFDYALSDGKNQVWKIYIGNGTASPHDIAVFARFRYIENFIGVNSGEF